MMEDKRGNDTEWKLIYVLPNLILDKPFETKFTAIVPFNDKRLQTIKSREISAKKLLANFKTFTGKKIKPCSLIMRDDAPKSVKNIEAVVAFRNTLAISCLVYNCSVSVEGNNVFGPAYSDHFDFHPINLAKGGGFIISSPALQAYGLRLEKFYGYTYPHLPYYDKFEAKPDEFLARKIIKLWIERFVSPGKDTWKTRLLFRSLEMAYQAMVTPFRNNSTLYDYGTNLALWVSAFEILVHKKPNDRVEWKNVCDFLGMFRWNPTRLRDKRFILRKDKKRNKVTRGNLVQKLYKELYDARCDFLHGNQVKKSRIFPFHNKRRPPLGNLAPSIYWTALSVFIPSENSGDSVKTLGRALAESMHNSTYKQALLSSIGVDLYN